MGSPYPEFLASIKDHCNQKARGESFLGPQRSFEGMFSGPHQFTLLGDNQHGNPLITQAILDHISEMARSGVKHLMLEFLPEGRSQELIEGFYAKPPTVTEQDIRNNFMLFEVVVA